MILILSTSTDLDTEKVIEWLKHYNKLFFRLNDEDLMMGITEFYYNPNEADKAYFKRDDKKLYIKDINKVWFRKFGFLASYEKIFSRNNDFYKYLYSEFSATRELVFELLSEKKWLYKKGVLPSKPMTLKRAKECGLKIPNSIITTNKSILYSFHKSNTNLITKPIGEGKQVKLKEISYSFMTLGVSTIENIAEKFSPSYIQNKIEKDYEIRAFFIDDKIFSMAIFSQNDKKTELDFRVFDHNKPLRFVPYKLPISIEKKIIRLMNNLKLNTGSIDFIKSSEGEYIFLEVNPAGQFGMTAYPCNFPLHEQVALTLINL